MLTANDATFDAEVLRAPGLTLVAFGASWCGPCKAALPHLHTLAAEGVRVVYVDVDGAQRTAVRYGVKGVPTYMVFRGGKVVAQHSGAGASILHTLRGLVRTT